MPIRTTAPKPELEQLTLTPEQSDAVGLSDSQKQQKVIEEAAKRKDWKSPTIDASGKYVTEQDITDVLCSGSGFAAVTSVCKNTFRPAAAHGKRTG